MASSSAGVRLSVEDEIKTAIGEHGLVIMTARGAFAATIAREDASLDEYHRALAGIRDAIDRQLGVSAPKPEPIKVGDRVALHGYDHEGKVREIDGLAGAALVTLDDYTWRCVSLDRLTKVPA